MRHDIVIYAHELPASLRQQFDARLVDRYGKRTPPAEDRELRLTVESTETDPEKVKAMVLERLANDG